MGMMWRRCTSCPAITHYSSLHKAEHSKRKRFNNPTNMMTRLVFLLVAFFAAASSVSAFTVGPTGGSRSVVSTSSSSTRLYFFGGPKDDGKPGDYVCRVRTWWIGTKQEKVSHFSVSFDDRYLPSSRFSRLQFTQDCGYVFTGGPEKWAALPDNWSCPPCGAPKRRFKKVPKGSASGKVEVKKSWF